MGEAAPDSSSPPNTTGQNKGPVILGVSWTFTFLAFLFVAGRLYSRKRKLGKWAADDYIVLVSFVRTPSPPCVSAPCHPCSLHFLSSSSNPNLIMHHSTGPSSTICRVRHRRHRHRRRPPQQHALAVAGRGRVGADPGRPDDGRAVFHPHQGRRRHPPHQATSPVAVPHPLPVGAGRRQRLVHGGRRPDFLPAVHAPAGAVEPGDQTQVLGSGCCDGLCDQRQW